MYIYDDILFKIELLRYATFAARFENIVRLGFVSHVHWQCTLLIALRKWSNITVITEVRRK